MTSSDLDLRLLRFRSRRDEFPHALASALIEAGRSHDALEVIHLGLLDDESDVELLTLEGRAFYEQGHLREAQSSLLRAAKLKPGHKEPYRWLAQVLIERGEALRAVQVLERALIIDPNDAALRQAHARAQRLASDARREPAAPAARRPSAPPRPQSSRPPPARPRTSSDRPPKPASEPPPARRPTSDPPSKPPSEPPRPSSDPPTKPREIPSRRPPATPSVPSPSLPSRPAQPQPGARQVRDAGSTRGRLAEMAARAAKLWPRPRAKRDAIAEDLLREPSGEPEAERWQPHAKTTPHLSPFVGPQPLEPDEDEDEPPTTALEFPDQMRNWLRTETARAEGSILPPDDDDDDDEEDYEPTSIMPSAHELELLNQDRERARAHRREPAFFDPAFAEPGLEDPTLIDQVSTLAEPGQAEPPEQVLALLRSQGIYESSRAPAVDGWVRKEEAARPGTPIQRALIMGWALALLAAVGGYYGFQTWLGRRRVDADALVESARADALDGAHGSLVSADEKLSKARALDPRSLPALEALLFVRAARALEEGSTNLAPVRELLTRAVQAQLSSPLVAAADALVRPPEERKQALERALERLESEDDARARYLVGRLAQRMGKFELAGQQLARAASLEPELALAWLGQAEQARVEGQLERAKEWFEKALGPDRRALRAELWLAVIATRPEQADGLRSELDALMPRVKQGSDAERMLAHSAQAFAELAAGDAAQARAALQKASGLRVADPELLAFFSQQALRAGEPLVAYRAARAASDAGGGAERYQTLVAAALLQRGEGEAALSALANLGDSHGALALARAAAALLTNAREALEAAKRELASYRATPAGKEDVEASSLLMRVDLRLGANGESLLPAARALVQRAPEAPAAHLALGEVLVAAGQAPEAIQALQPALRLAPGSADGHYLLGCAQRLAGHPAEARQSFERAVAIATNHLEARRALGRALLEAGEYDAALALFRELEGTAGPSATLGSIEALLGKGSVEDAARLLEKLPEPLKAMPDTQLLRARVALARGQPLEALPLLEPLVADDSEVRTPEALTLYGNALYAADRVEPAVSAYEDALELDESFPDALLGRAIAAVRAERPDQALSWVARAETALASRPRPPSVRAQVLVTAAKADLLGQQVAQLTRARERLSRAIVLPGAPAESYFWYGEALTRSKANNARDQYAKYLALEPSGPYAARAKRAISPR